MDSEMMKCIGGNMVIKRCCDVLRIAIGITMLALLLAGNANAATITVNASGGGDYLKIQKAINASSNGDTILVYSGIYHENVNITKQLTLRGIGNPVVDAGGSGSAITLSANGITLEGFKATGSGNDQEAGIRVTSFNNTLTGNKASKNYYGIYLDMSCNNTLTGNNALNNNYGISLYESSVKYGIYLSSSSNNTIRGNIDGISLSSSSSNTLTGNNGGIYLEYSSNNTLTGNNASNNYFGIRLSYSSNNNTLIGNIANSNVEKGISLSSSQKNTLSYNNVSSNNGDGISLSHSNYNTLTGNNASNNGNEITENYGAGIWLSSSSNNKIYNNIFNNTKNFRLEKSNTQAWNTPRQSGTNIIAGPYLGGNFWAKPDGTGFSQTCRDVNGDGICDKSKILDANNIDYLPLSMNFTKYKMPPKSVRNLKNESYASTYINWTWTDPKDNDFDKVQIYINNIYKTSVLKGVQYYKAKNLYANRSYTISTRTVDKSGNVNLTWKSNTAWTKPALTVCPGRCAYSNINAAIGAASSGDTIEVHGGTYYENVNVTKQLTLHGIGNPVVDAGGSGSTITLSANGITLEGFTATGAGDYPGAGIKITSSNDNKIYHNNLINNTNQAMDGTNTNSWDNSYPNGGNYWSDYTGTDSNNDGIGDTPYSIPGGNSIDRYPLMAPYTGELPMPIIDSIHNINKSTNYITIQEAIDDASPGDEICVDSGTYYENVIINKQLTLHGMDTGKGNPLVDAGGSGTAITLSANGIILERFTATGSGYYYYDSQEAGIMVISNNNTLTNNIASNNQNGIRLFHSSNNTLRGNNASKNFIGMDLAISSNNTMSGNNASNNNYYGVSLGSSSNNTLSGNNASNNEHGIWLSSSNNNTMTGNNASNNKIYGIYLIDTSNNTLFGNYASNNKIYGIYLIDSSNNMLVGNNASNSGEYGIFLSSSSNNTMSGNNASNNRYGIRLLHSSNNKLSENNASSNDLKGISMSHSSKNKLIGNKASNNSDGLHLRSSNKNTLVGNKASNNGIGIRLSYSSNNNTLTGNNASNSGQYGICLSYSSKNNTLRGNNALNNYFGISLSSSDNNTISGNNASNNIFGIWLSDSSNNKLTGNNANSNNGIGIRLSYSSNNNTLIGNNASNNGNEYVYHDYGYSYGYGIYLSYNSKNMLNGNNASNNSYGIYLRSSRNNKIYNNIFNNTNNLDFHGNKTNRWNISRQSDTNIIGGPYLGGNFWANPNGTGFSQTCPDANGDGICDKRYILDENNIDYLPLAKDNIPPKSVSKLKNITYAQNYINWTWKDPKDADFKKVIVFIDSKFKKNVSKGKRFYNATNFTANTRHTISTKTVDMNGNINKTWTNSSAWTAK